MGVPFFCLVLRLPKRISVFLLVAVCIICVLLVSLEDPPKGVLIGTLCLSASFLIGATNASGFPKYQRSQLAADFVAANQLGSGSKVDMHHGTLVNGTQTSGAPGGLLLTHDHLENN